MSTRTRKQAPRAARSRAVAPVQQHVWELRLLVAIVVGSALVIWPRLLDPFMLPKVTLVGLLVVALVAVTGVGALRAGRVTVPVGLPVWVALGLAGAFVAAAVAADPLALELVGPYSRYTGLLPYLGYLIVFLVAARISRQAGSRVLVMSVLVAAGVMLLYGFVQLVGLDPFSFNVGRDKPLFSTMGNTNFSSAYVGIGVGLAVWYAVFESRSRRALLAVGAGVVAAGAYLIVVGSIQGPLVAVVTTGFVVVAVLVEPDTRRRISRTIGVPRLKWAPVAAVALVLAGAVALGSYVAAQLEASLRERLQFWETAITIFRENPVFGAGLSSFGTLFPRLRPAEHAAERGLQVTDTVHQVPLSMFATGGLLLGLAYVAFVLVVGVSLVRGLRSLVGAPRQALVGAGAVWLGYQVQSLVSIDVPPLAVLHFVSAGVIAALSGAVRPVTLTLPGLRPAGSRSVLSSPRRAVPATVLVVLALAAAAVVLVPARADASAAEAFRNSKDPRSLQDLAAATQTAPWESRYWRYFAEGLVAAKQDEQAVNAVVRAARLAPGSPAAALTAASLAASTGNDELAQRWYAEAVERDPNNPEVLVPAAEFAAAEGDTARAAELLERAVRLKPADVELRLQFAEALESAGRDGDAVAEYRAILEREPENDLARERLTQLT